MWTRSTMIPVASQMIRPQAIDVDVNNSHTPLPKYNLAILYNCHAGDTPGASASIDLAVRCFGVPQHDKRMPRHFRIMTAHLALHSGQRHALDEVALEQEEDTDHRQRHQDVARHDDRPTVIGAGQRAQKAQTIQAQR